MSAEVYNNKEGFTNVTGTTEETTRRNQRRLALEEIDNAKFGWFHIRACIVSGIGFFTDAYDIFIISIVTQILGYVYFADEANGNVVPPNIDLGLKVSTPVGTLIGQLFFGWLADRIGRKKMYGVELIIIVVCTIASAFAANSAKGITVWGMIIMWRVILGVGIGGDYPLSAIITSEFATTRNRGAMISAVFAMQGLGILTGACVSTLVIVIFQGAINADVLNLDYVWRIIVGLGAVPGVAAIYYRLTIPETPRYTMDVDRNFNQATRDVAHIMKINNSKADKDVEVGPLTAPTDNVNRIPKASWADFRNYFGQWKHGKVLLGTSVTWFALDVAFYGINLNNSIILKAIGFADPGTPYHELVRAAIGGIIIALLGTVPGYWVTVFTVDRIGRKTIQLMGFIALTIIFVILGAAYHKILETSTALFVVIFTLGQFFQNFGPNVTTFVIPGELFPTRYRSTAHGISAASGKLGAIVAQVGFSKLKDIGGHNAFMDKLILIFAAFMLIGFFFTFLIPETKGKTLEELNGEWDGILEDEENAAQEASERRHPEAEEVTLPGV
ncbi:MAG: phosphate transporter [Piptocephalis tieghemiana]|nr:MAG: phosphate transporter [Piptocephalis tieghemiana]